MRLYLLRNSPVWGRAFAACALFPLVAAIALAQQKKQERDLKFEADPAITAPAKPPGGKTIPRSYALIVGVGDYKNLPPSAKLEFAERDAEAIYSILISPEGGNFRAENVRKLTGAKATLANMKRELETWLPGAAKADDRVLVYFAGHGFVDPKSGKAYLAPYDLEPGNISGTGYSMDQLGSVIGSKVSAKWKVLLTDSCHSGAISPEQGEIVNKSLLDLNRSMFSMTASRARERSFESKDWGGGHGIFTYYIVRGLEGYADENKDSIVTADELAEYTRRNVREATKGQQNPTSDKGNFDPNMLLAFFPSRVSPGEAPAPKFGTWVIEANMDSVEVFVDGKSMGVVSKGSPLRLPGLQPGIHSVRGVRMGYEPDGPREETVYPGQESTISIKISIPRRRTKAALDPFERGLDLYNKGNKDAYLKASKEFQAAIAADANFSQAWLYLARVQRGGMTFHHAPGDPWDDDLERAVVEADGAVGADGRGGGAFGDLHEFHAHPSLLLSREFAGGDLGHPHAAHRTIARPVADEVHHRAGVTLAGRCGR